MLRLINSFRHNDEGIAFIEFGFILPLLITIFYAVVELTRFVLMNQKLDNAAHTITDLVNQSLVPSCASIQTLIEAVPQMLRPYFDEEGGVEVVVTSIEVPEDETEPVTNWQYPAGSPMSRYSSVPGTPAALPDLLLQERQQVLVVEMNMIYRPIMDNDFVRNVLEIADQGVYKRIIARPRYGAFNFPPC